MDSNSSWVTVLSWKDEPQKQGTIILLNNAWWEHPSAAPTWELPAESATNSSQPLGSPMDDLGAEVVQAKRDYSPYLRKRIPWITHLFSQANLILRMCKKNAQVHKGLLAGLHKG